MPEERYQLTQDRSIIEASDFEAIISRLPGLLADLLACPPHKFGAELPGDMPVRGVYLFSKGSDHFYVGRTNRLRARHREHCTGRNNDAPFPFKMARHATGHVKAKGGLTRKALEVDQAFAAAFADAKSQVRVMEWRWVAIDDANTQAVFEVYATMQLKARFNDFENH